MPFVFELRDLWPASIVEVGAMKKNFIIKVFENIELKLYKKAKLIISVTNSFKINLQNRGIDKSKIKVITNGVDDTLYFPREKEYHILKDFDLEGKFIIGYIGTHGMAHNIGSLLNVAKNLESNEDILFLFVGSEHIKKF